LIINLYKIVLYNMTLITIYSISENNIIYCDIDIELKDGNIGAFNKLFLEDVGINKVFERACKLLLHESILNIINIGKTDNLDWRQFSKYLVTTHGNDATCQSNPDCLFQILQNENVVFDDITFKVMCINI